MFGRNSSTVTIPSDTVVDEPTSDVLDRPETPLVDEPTVERREDEAARAAAADQAAADDTQRIMTTPKERIETEPVEPATIEREPVERERVETSKPARTRWAHVSLLGTLSVVVATLAVAATFTGLLAPLGFAAGILAVIFGILAAPNVRRANVTGHGLVTFGVVVGAAAIVLSMLAMGGQLSWLSSKTDEIATVHAWLNDHMHWLRRW